MRVREGQKTNEMRVDESRKVANPLLVCKLPSSNFHSQRLIHSASNFWCSQPLHLLAPCTQMNKREKAELRQRFYNELSHKAKVNQTFITPKTTLPNRDWFAEQGPYSLMFVLPLC